MTQVRSSAGDSWLAIATIFIFFTHLYTFGGKTMMQEDGGAIRLRFICALAKLRMAVWARSFTTKLKDTGGNLWLAKGYVDDLKFWVKKLELGSRLVEGKLVWNEEWEKEDIRNNISREWMTAKEMLKLMDKITPDIKKTVEISEDFHNYTIPTLDTQMEVKYITEKGKTFPQTCYQFFKKPTSSKLCMLESSAQPNITQQSTLTQELIRRPMNCCSRTPIDTMIKGDEEFNNTLKMSGYSTLQRHKVLEAGLLGYASRVERARDNNLPLHRGQRRLLKMAEKNTWFKKTSMDQEHDAQGAPGNKGPRKKGGRNQPGVETTPTTVLFVPRTRVGKLATMMNENEGELRGFSNKGIKVVEQAGTTLMTLLTSSNPVKLPCGRPECAMCPLGDINVGRCYAQNLVYISECTLCLEDSKLGNYIGETARLITE